MQANSAIDTTKQKNNVGNVVVECAFGRALLMAQHYWESKELSRKKTRENMMSLAVC